MKIVNQALSALRRVSIVVAIAIAFLFGLATTVYLSLRSPEVKVPDVVGKDRFEAEHILGNAGLNFRVRATRPSGEMKADTVLFQLPRAGEVVKAGQTVAMDISRTAKEGESSEAVVAEKDETKPESRNSSETAASNENENKPKRNKNTNQNVNENSNTNALNRNANANRPAVNKNANAQNANAIPNINSVRPSGNKNSSADQNENSRPPTPKPLPSNKPTPEQP